jgi:5-hydroxyisourate hydrolase-like protein (transthyretin family)
MVISAQRLGGPAMAVAAPLKRNARNIQTLIRSLKTIGSGRIDFMYLYCGPEALAGCLSSTTKTQLMHTLPRLGV